MEWSSELRLSYDAIDAAYLFKSLTAEEPEGALQDATINSGGEMAWMKWAWLRSIEAAMSLEKLVWNAGHGNLFENVTFAYEVLDPGCDLPQLLIAEWQTDTDTLVQSWLEKQIAAAENP